MLFTRLQWGPDGEPRIPGSLDVWKQVLVEKSEPKLSHDLGRRARGWKRPEQLLEAMAALSRIDTDMGPLQIYLMLSEVDSRRPSDKRLTPETVLCWPASSPSSVTGTLCSQNFLTSTIPRSRVL